MSKIKFPFQFLAIIWVVFIVNAILPIDLNNFGLLPRSERGLFGIFTAPFLHVNLNHIISNSVPLLVLLLTTSFVYSTRIYSIIFSIVLIGGGMEWLFARTAYHIGASGLIYGLVGFLTFSGIYQRRLVPFIVAVAIGLVYGTTMWMGMLPMQCSSISWEGHLFGAIAGIITARMMRNKGIEHEQERA